MNPSAFLAGPSTPNPLDASDAIAVIGMAGRFPESEDVGALWDHLAAGHELIRDVTDEELQAAGVDPALLRDGHYLRRAAMVPGIPLFDAPFFGITPREAALTDPQQRLFLETAWHALEDAGYVPDHLPGRAGIFAGAATSRYFLEHLARRQDLADGGGAMQLLIGNEKDFLCSRIAYHLNLTGPAVSVQTACSTSLVAVHLACRSLLDRDCDVALAGGVSITTLVPQGYLHVEGSIASRDGHCRAFDGRSSGTVGGNGLGIVVLKRLDRALADGDTVRAVIRGSAINNDGIDKVGFTAPSVNGQATAIREALAAAKVEAGSISYVEAHGTGTLLGDPIEIRGLAEAMRARTPRTQPCLIGSIKTNVGHLDTAAGVAGLIKTVLSLQHRQIPPTLHFEQPNPHIDFDAGPFRVNTRLVDWPAGDGPRRAGVSSFGIGGTNAHVIVEEAQQPPSPASARASHVLVLSARSAAALDEATARWSRRLHELQGRPDASLADVAFTSQVGRRHFAWRRALACDSLEQAARALAGAPATEVRDVPGLVFMFPGQGSQSVDMARELYESEPTLREELDACAQVLARWLDLDLRELLFPASEPQREHARAQLGRTRYTQPALFAVEYALARLLQSWGLEPAAMIGHSVGEYVAACLAGVMSRDDALYLVCERARLMERMPGGAMLSVQLEPSAVRALLGPHLGLAAVNAPDLCTVAGEHAAIEALVGQLEAQDIACQRLHTSHAFHCAMMEPMLAEFERCFEAVTLSAPRLPYVSNVTGTWITPAQATSAKYWASHVREPVRFAEGLQALASAAPDQLLLEVGPGRTLLALARRNGQAARTLAVLPHSASTQGQQAACWDTIAQLWSRGVPVQWTQVHRHEHRRRVALPGYPFERQRHWIEPPRAAASPAAGGAPASMPVLRREDRDDWFYAPVWKRAARAAMPTATARAVHLVMVDRHGLDQHVVELLREREQRVLVVEAGECFEQIGHDTWTLDPADASHYARLLGMLQQQGQLPARITHLLGLTPTHPADAGLALVDGLHSVRALGRAWRELGELPLTLTVVTNGACAVTGTEWMQAEKAAVLGPCLVLPLEQPALHCRHVDVQIEGDYSMDKSLAAALVNECCSEPGLPQVAHRGRYRWVPDYEPVRLEQDGAGATASTAATAVRDGGCYVITGGLGGIGLCFAQFVAAQARRPVLVIVGRTPLPQPAHWSAEAARLGTDDPVGARLASLLALQQAGADVRYHALDVADAHALRTLAAELRDDGLHVSGVFHAAGVAEGHRETDPAISPFTDMLAPKLLGARNLVDAFDAHALDFLLLCSSMSTVHPLSGQSEYSAANAFLDAFAAEQRATGVRALAVGWSTWQQVGMAAVRAHALPKEMREQHLIYLSECIGPADAPQLFNRILRSAESRLLVTPMPLEAVAAGTAALNDRIAAQFQEPLPPGATGAPRPALRTEYVAASNDVEHALLEIWESLFGISGLGVHDDFFELGGHSLLATQVVYKVRASFDVDLSLRELFQHATIATLARRVEDLILAEIMEMSDQEAHQLVNEINTSAQT